jgi:maltooligosyltrehalose trehalohydrolase
MRVNVSKRNIGLNFSETGTAEITIWSPLANSVEIELSAQGKKIPLAKHEDGYWKMSSSEISAGTCYKISINGGQAFPEPTSLAQPDGVHGSSMAIDVKKYKWSDKNWENIPLAEYIIYELHTGTFSPEHTFDGIAAKIDHLSKLGITAIEIMPVGQFPGDRNWGYDGVFPFAVQHSYGGAEKLQELVNACHQKGIAVILDVIYNHLGPEGNYLPEFAPYFTNKYSTPWGKALNFDDAWCDGVREYFIENALMWFRDFHVDALRMDAVHAIKDFSTKHIIREIREHVDELEKLTGKKHYLIAEMDLNDPVYINPYDKCGYGVNAQWIDEFHHTLRVTAGQSPEGYYSDFNGIDHLAKSYVDAYVYDGQFSNHRKKNFGAKTDNAGHQFVVFSQNHDQVGNRMLGERTNRLVSADMCRLMAAAVIVSPFLPMFFMGEEWLETNPFLFFVSHTDKELAALVNKGRKEEFSYFNWKGEPPDPRLEETFLNSMLQWDLLTKQPHDQMLAYYKELIRLRKTVPALKVPDRTATNAFADNKKKVLTLQRSNASQFIECIMNFSDEIRPLQFTDQARIKYRLILDSSLPEWGGKGQRQENFICAESILIFERHEQ